jgi:hypothetical protein
MEWYAFDPEDAAGINVAMCGRDQWGIAWVVAARGSGAPPRVRAYILENYTYYLMYEWDAYESTWGGGVRVSCSVLDGIAVVMTGPGPTGGPHVRLWGLLPPEP